MSQEMPAADGRAAVDPSGPSRAGSFERLARIVEGLLRTPVVAWRPVSGGWSVAVRGVFELSDGRTVFAKTGEVADTIKAIRTECRVYEVLSGPYVPRLVAADDSVPVLVLEDMSDRTWPPPWTPGLLQALDRLFAELASTTAPTGLPRLAATLAERGAWERVAADPEPLLGSGLVGRRWLDHALPGLLDAQSSARTEGDRLLHLDVRSDNVCFHEGRGWLVDWNHAVVGDPRWDRLLMLHTITMEGGPGVRELERDPDPGIVAWLAGFFASQLGLPPRDGAPTVRAFQRAQFELLIPWAAELLGLPSPDGVDR